MPLQLQCNRDEEGVWEQVLAMVVSSIATSRVLSNVRVSRSLLVGGYIGQGVERLDLPQVVASEEVRSLVPAAVWKDIGFPIVVYAYSEPLFKHACNWASASRNLGTPSRQCLCGKPETSCRS